MTPTAAYFRGVVDGAARYVHTMLRDRSDAELDAICTAVAALGGPALQRLPRDAPAPKRCPTIVLRADEPLSALGVATGDSVVIEPGAANPVALVRRLQDVPRSAWEAAVVAGDLAPDNRVGYSGTLQALRDFADEPLPGLAPKRRRRNRAEER